MWNAFCDPEKSINISFQISKQLTDYIQISLLILTELKQID